MVEPLGVGPPTAHEETLHYGVPQQGANAKVSPPPFTLMTLSAEEGKEHRPLCRHRQLHTLKSSALCTMRIAFRSRTGQASSPHVWAIWGRFQTNIVTGLLEEELPRPLDCR
jgi:hypothetical protein